MLGRRQTGRLMRHRHSGQRGGAASSSTQSEHRLCPQPGSVSATRTVVSWQTALQVGHVGASCRAQHRGRDGQHMGRDARPVPTALRPDLGESWPVLTLKSSMLLGIPGSDWNLG